MKANFVLAGMMAVFFGSAQADIYRWVDKSGQVHYGDRPAAEATEVEQKKFAFPAVEEGAKQGGGEQPYETRRALENFPVMFYYASNCGIPCQQARDFLNKRGIPFTEKNLVTQEEINDFVKQSGSDQSPTLGVGKTYLKGFEAGQWNSELDIAGYPKIAPYRPQAPVRVQTGKPAAE